jgi:hypothetical protein
MFICLLKEADDRPHATKTAFRLTAMRGRRLAAAATSVVLCPFLSALAQSALRNANRILWRKRPALVREFSRFRVALLSSNVFATVFYFALTVVRLLSHRSRDFSFSRHQR